LPAAASAEPVDLSLWTVVQYELFDQPDASWVLSAGNTVVTQTVNADASIYLSDFDITHTDIRGSWTALSSSDDDFMGFVFGLQGRGKFYLFDWKRGDQPDGLGFAERGMTIKVVNIPGSADPVGTDLWPTAGSARVAQLYHNTTPWEFNTLYDFHLLFHPGQFTIEVFDGVTPLLQQTINDNTFPAGQFGFYNYSQGNIQYQSFTREVLPTPEPVGAAIFGIGMAIVSAASRRLRRAAGRSAA
jgi:hypothetical protein